MILEATTLNCYPNSYSPRVDRFHFSFRWFGRHSRWGLSLKLPWVFWSNPLKCLGRYENCRYIEFFTFTFILLDYWDILVKYLRIPETQLLTLRLTVHKFLKTAFAMTQVVILLLLIKFFILTSSNGSASSLSCDFFFNSLLLSFFLA